ncbi:hypothetical protein D3C73_1157420 [compost metagenome]
MASPPLAGADAAFKVVRLGWTAMPAMPPPPPMLCATMPCALVPAVMMLPPTSWVTVTLPPAPFIRELEPNVMFMGAAMGWTPLSIEA